jgi:hypothetical protein
MKLGKLWLGMKHAEDKYKSILNLKEETIWETMALVE